MIPFGKYRSFNKFLMVSVVFLTTCSSQTLSLETSCTSADEFAAPADGHCLPLRSCTAIHSGSNTPKFRLILKALLCEQDDSSLENPKICCPDVKTNLIGKPTDVTQNTEFFTFSKENGEREDVKITEDDSQEVTTEESSEFDYKDNNSSGIVVPEPMNVVMTTKMTVNNRDSQEDEKAAGTSTTTEPSEDANVESRGESQEDLVTTTTEVNENETKMELEWDGSGEITSETNAVTETTTDDDFRGKMMAMVENSNNGQVEYEIGFGPTLL